MGIVAEPRAGTETAGEPLAARMARQAAAASWESLGERVAAKVKVCLMDLIGCAFESAALPWSRQAVALAHPLPAPSAGAATIIGSPLFVSPADAAYANAVMGHGLVREDMHSGSISHLGIVVLPSLLALAQSRTVTGREFIVAAAVGYETGAKVGRAVMDAELARIFRPTGVTGPIAAAAACARLLGLEAGATTSALALGVNSVAGYNQWPHTGGSEMFFQAGAAARSGLTAARLAANGAFGSPSAFDGEAGLFAAMRKAPPAGGITLFDGDPEILAVYHKPVPACNFAQTASQAAVRVAQSARLAPEDIRAITIRVPRAGKLYPGCDSVGPFEHVLQAKMSIQYNVAAALMRGQVSEGNFALLADATLHRLIGTMTLVADDEMTRAYPGLQGGEVQVDTVRGESHRVRLGDVVNATAEDVRARFRAALGAALGAARTAEVEQFIGTLETATDAGRLGGLLRADGGS